MNCRKIYIRHADKEYVNGDSIRFKHDPGITETGKNKTKDLANILVDKWGLPDMILTSPYERTRQTAKILNSELETRVPMYIDSDLSEYLGNHREVPLDVKEETAKHNPPHPETFPDMKLRVKNHHIKIQRYLSGKENVVVWIVTHGLVIKQIAYLMGLKICKDFPTLTCLSLSENDNNNEIVIFNEN